MNQQQFNTADKLKQNMNNILLYIILLFLFLIVNSCQYFSQMSYEEWKENSSGVETGVDVFFGGLCYESGTYYASYWKNNELTVLGTTATSGAGVFSIALDVDNVYCGGCYANGSKDNACWWKNGELVKPEVDDTGQTSQIKSITVACGIVFACGLENSIACYWINGKKHSLSLPSSAVTSYSSSIVVDEDTLDFYIAGYYTDSTTVACWWKNGTECVTLPTPVEGEDYRALAACLSNGELYTAGFYNGSTTPLPCYWKSGRCITLPNDGYGQTRGITVYNGSVYIAGRQGITGTVYPSLWKDGSILWMHSSTGNPAAGVAVYDNDIYLPFYSDTYYWKNGAGTDLYNPYSGGNTFCVAVRAKR